MTHIELIEFLYKHREKLDSIYKGKDITVNETLEASKIITRIGEKIELSESYRNFIDVTLNRIDYATVFHTYSSELQELLKYKERYELEQKENYLDDILSLLKTIFLKLDKRDQEIRTLLVKIENETSLDLDLLIEKALDILEKIEEVNRANNEVRELFYNEIYTVHPRTKNFIDNISNAMLAFVENISVSLDRLKQFIARTRKLRLQNRQLHQLAIQILEEKDQNLEEFLSLNPKENYLTLYRSQKNTIKSFPDGSESSKVIRKLRRELSMLQVKKEPKSFIIKAQKEEKLNLVNIMTIEDELERIGSADIFEFIYQHPELKRFVQTTSNEESLKEESFKVYLQFVIPHNPKIVVSQKYNEHNVRVAKWI
jgi:hypothetical protein